MFSVFVRNNDGTLKTKKPCQTPGCGWPNWHICLDASDPGHTKVHAVKAPRPRMSQEQKDKIAEAQRQRHAIRRLETYERDELIIKHYTEGNLGMSKIAKLMDLSQGTVNKVLNKAKREGRVTIRPKNQTLYRPGK